MRRFGSASIFERMLSSSVQAGRSLSTKRWRSMITKRKWSDGVMEWWSNEKMKTWSIVRRQPPAGTLGPILQYSNTLSLHSYKLPLFHVQILRNQFGAEPFIFQQRKTDAPPLQHPFQLPQLVPEQMPAQ